MKYSELFFLSSTSQSNIYNISLIPDECEHFILRKILIFYLNPSIPNEQLLFTNDIISVEKNNNNDSIHSIVKHIEFPDINMTSEVISIDSFVDIKNKVLSIAIGLIKIGNKPKSMIHIYESAVVSNDSLDVQKFILVYKKDIIFNPLCIRHSKVREMDTAPSSPTAQCYFMAVSTEAVSSVNKEKTSPLILAFARLSNNAVASSTTSTLDTATDNDFADLQRERRTVRPSLFQEKPGKKRGDKEDFMARYDGLQQRRYFEPILPESCREIIKEKVLSMDIKVSEDNALRVSLFGTESGRFIYMVADVEKSILLRHYIGCHNSPITSVLLVPSMQYSDRSEDKASSSHDYHALICSAIEKSVLYRRVDSSAGFHSNTDRTISSEPAGTTNQFCLTQSSEYDVVMCAAAADVDMDGDLELIVGTYQQKLLFYKWVSFGHDQGIFRIVGKIKCAGPVFAVRHVDVTGDGLRELVVLTSRGLHIFQLDLDYVQSILVRRINP